jgi:hypothetical protein
MRPGSFRAWRGRRGVSGRSWGQPLTACGSIVLCWAPTCWVAPARRDEARVPRTRWAWVVPLFPKKNTRCFLSRLVVSPPCHSWLPPRVVTLTGEAETRENVMRPGIYFESPGEMTEACARFSLFPVNRPRSLTIEPRLTPFGRRRCYLPDREPLLLAGARRFLMQSAKRKSWGAQAYFFVRRASQDAARQSCARKAPAHPPPLNRAESCTPLRKGLQEKGILKGLVRR